MTHACNDRCTSFPCRRDACDDRDYGFSHTSSVSKYFFTSRSCNKCAHELARSSLSWDSDQSCVWLNPLPEFVKLLAVHNFPEPQTKRFVVMPIV
uniref:Uncharacterized protein n=1 Tax=Setaria italica TaxID=4555 RepID=K3YZ44_SETIT